MGNSSAEQALIRELRAIDIRINSVESFFRASEANAEVDQIALHELMEMDGVDQTRAVEEAYARFHAARN